LGSFIIGKKPSLFTNILKTESPAREPYTFCEIRQMLKKYDAFDSLAARNMAQFHPQRDETKPEGRAEEMEMYGTGVN
jgi:hypothetical protein